MSSSVFAQDIFPGVAETKNACGKKMTAEMKAQRALDIQEIINVAGMHEYYHSALMHKEEYENIFSKRDDVTWTNNSDKYVGKDFIKFYVDGCPQGEAKRGALWYHMLATPVVVVAGDGQTAKAVWQSFGNVSGTGMLQWTQEKYGMDFIKEDGKWKIWHLRTYVEFYTDATTTNTTLWMGQNLAAPTGASNAATVPEGTPGGGPTAEVEDDGVTIKEEPGVKFADDLKPTEKGNYYEGYSENYMPTFNPVPPEPYCTWEDTWAY